MISVLSGLAASVALAAAQCPDYADYSKEPHEPYSGGRYNLPYQRPAPACRTFNSSIVESTISDISKKIADPDLRRLFENAYPNTLDTAVAWHGHADDAQDVELTFLITGDIHAMWLRDSANQMQSYLPLLSASDSFDSLASLYRGVINLQSRYIGIDPYCNSFQPPVESKISPTENTYGASDVVRPQYSKESVFECKYELDSLAAFLEVSTNYYDATKDADFFKKYKWVAAVQSILQVAEDMMVPTYQENGNVSELTYSFTRQSDRASETIENSGLGNPFNSGTGLIRSFFRPSDDATIFMGFIPANAMLSRYLGCAANIATAIGETDLASRMTNLSSSLRTAITKHGIVHTAGGDQVYAYEVDGYSSQNIMDDANIPSLLSLPFLGYLDVNDPVYQTTRSLLLSAQNPYYMRGPNISAIGGAHNGPGYAWPMASIVRILTSNDDSEITEQLKELVSTTSGLGLIHESINTFNGSDFTRTCKLQPWHRKSSPSPAPPPASATTWSRNALSEGDQVVATARTSSKLNLDNTSKHNYLPVDCDVTDPDSIHDVRAMWEIAKMEDPPLRTVIGSDACEAIMGKIKSYGELCPEYKDLAYSTDVDGYQKPS
ncbi:glycoside hydrolase family 125 protein [Teratosphaeria destructans]|uniref:Glycoside hydrolase family 125 protein n=1 Tax=Teratosphaeria destructans TaxID=418781 RepID=A0A9W7SMN9_9PEZI|nr:glycoside hydrolase family 125 protein [Teratosphaeria destructans]